MPMILTKTNTPISEADELELKELFGKAIEILPGKTETWLMLGFEENCRLWFRGDNSKPLAYVEVSALGKISPDSAEKLTAEICSILKDVLGIEGDGVYVKYEETDKWGFDGGNF
ncbi:MAG: hypothetical protein IJN78_04875 [Clostridia bacterium]|nr:hypothetical protein [Clostridia bacterium]